MRGKCFFPDYPIKQMIGIVKQFSCFFSLSWIIQNVRILSAQLPDNKKEYPADIIPDFFEWKIMICFYARKIEVQQSAIDPM